MGQGSANPTEDPRLLLEQSLGVPFVGGNRLSLLKNGAEIFPRMLGALKAARHRIDFATYVYWSGAIADQFARTLAERAEDGLRVRVLLDAVGASKMDASLVQLLRDAGAELRWFRRPSWRLWRADKRMHRKILVTDDELAFTGGVGIAEEWEGDARHPGEWRETHVELRGPAVSGLRAAFLENWNEAGAWALDPPRTPPADCGDAHVQVVRSSTTIGWTDTSTLLRTLVAMSRTRLRITTGYFNPDEKLVQLLGDAAGRGVDVQVLMPGAHSDSRLSQLAGQVHLGSLLEAGVRLWRYEQTTLHAKLVTVDGIVACIGSANLNHRSLGKDEECCIVATCPDTAGTLDAQFREDCEASAPWTLTRWSQRGFGVKLKERLARLIVEQL